MSLSQATASQVLIDIHHQRDTAPLSILTLASPILTPEPHNGTSSPLNPATLQADLTHYRDLFSKLRFSYLEQVTKEKYLRSIVGEPPLLASADDNALLEEKLLSTKAELQAKKRAVEGLVQEIEDLARDIAARYDRVQLEVTHLETLPEEVGALEVEVQALQQQLREKEGAFEGESSDDPRMHLSLEETEGLIAEQRAKNDELKGEIHRLEGDIPMKVCECEEAERELGDLERRRNEVTRAAREGQRRKELGGRDLLEEQGRWYAASETVLRGLLGVQS